MNENRYLFESEAIAVVGAIRTELERLQGLSDAARDRGDLERVESARRVAGTLQRVRDRLLDRPEEVRPCS